MSLEKILMRAAAAAVSMVGVANAASQSTQSFSVSSIVSPECVFDDFSDETVGIALTLDSSATTSGLTIASATGQSITTDYFGCNYGSAPIQIVSTNGGLVNSGVAPEGFDNKLNYTISGSYTKADGTPGAFLLQSENGSGSVSPGGAWYGALTLVIQLSEDEIGARPLAGAFSDTATIIIGAGI